MPAYFDSGFCVRRPSWHQQEVLLDEYPESWDAARQIAGIGWEPVEHPLWIQTDVGYEDPIPAGAIGLDRYLPTTTTADGSRVAAINARVVTPVTTHKAIVRSDNGFHLGTVGAEWHPITHTVMGEVVEALLAETNVNIETMVCLKEGRQVAATILLDEPYTVAGDDSPTLPYLVLLNAHDGSSAFRAMATQVRVVCANTYQAAALDGQRSGRQFIFRHTSKVMDRIADAKQAIAGVRDDAAQWIELAADLAVLPAPTDVVDRFLSEFIPRPPANIVSDRVHRNIDEARSTFRMFYEASPTCAANHGTGLGLVHAAVEYLDHARGARTVDSRINRQLLRPEPLKAKAVTLVRELCTA